MNTLSLTLLLLQIRLNQSTYLIPKNSFLTMLSLSSQVFLWMNPLNIFVIGSTYIIRLPHFAKRD